VFLSEHPLFLFCIEENTEMVRVKEIYIWTDEYAPFRYAQSWDQCGLQVGDPGAEVQRILVALDASSRTIGEAEERHCQCLVTHHPLIFRPLHTMRTDRFPENLVVRALMSGIHVIAAHTNLDVAKEGTNNRMSRLLALECVKPLEVEAKWQHEASYGGMGCVGLLPQPMRLLDLMETAKQRLAVKHARLVGNTERQVQKIALCTGSGGSLLENAIHSGAEAYVTGDLKYHEAQRALEAGLELIDLGHFASERLIVQPLVQYFRQRAEKENVPLEVDAAACEEDPFLFFGKGVE
jgi:dinuclear metal center YbgI/SA1388 family protein